MTNQKIFYMALLLLVTFFWGVTFPLIKITLGFVSPVSFLVIRFLVSALILLPFVIRNKSLMRSRDIKLGISAGFLLFVGYFFQTVGLNYTTASQSGIITGLYVVLLPFISLVYLKLRPDRISIMASFIAFAGLIIMSAGNLGNSGIQLGDVLTVISAVAYAFQIAYVSKYSSSLDSLVFTFYQLLSVALFSSIFLPFMSSPFTVNYFVIFTILFTAVFAGVLAIFISNRSLIYIEPTAAGVIFVGEPVFAAVTSVIITGQILGIYTVVGGTIMIFAMFITTFRNYLMGRRIGHGTIDTDR
ncbi:MAG: DMT family transporter [Thermoplasmataceae archaeon]|jgi:drug/metabolite transporter (DMT)-like permease